MDQPPPIEIIATLQPVVAAATISNDPPPRPGDLLHPSAVRLRHTCLCTTAIIIAAAMLITTTTKLSYQAAACAPVKSDRQEEVLALFTPGHGQLADAPFRLHRHCPVLKADVWAVARVPRALPREPPITMAPLHHALDACLVMRVIELSPSCVQSPRSSSGLELPPALASNVVRSRQGATPCSGLY